MELSLLNRKMLAGCGLECGDLPAWDALGGQKYRFAVDFGLADLPDEPGLIILRGPRQYGKSTWLEFQISRSYETHGAGSCFYLNGDDIADEGELFEQCAQIVSLFGSGPVKRLFIDEISAVHNWQGAIKRLWDRGLSRDVLIVTTGSHAHDLLKGSELLPGRKGKLARSTFLFTPISYRSFCDAAFSSETQPPIADRIATYLLSGGSPLACNSLLEHGTIEPFIIQLVRDWIFGVIGGAGRDRGTALHIINELHLRGGSAVSLTKVSQEAGVANNTVALGYIELLESALFLHRSYPFDLGRGKQIARKESKFPFINLLGAVTFSPQRLRSVGDWHRLPESRQGVWIEWLVAQELWRRAMVRGDRFDQTIPFISSSDREIDFFVNDIAYEVKRGSATVDEFVWFHRAYPKKHLVVISSSRFETRWCTGVTLEDFLLGGGE